MTPPRPRDLIVIVAFGVALLVTLLSPWWGRDRLTAREVVEALTTLGPALTATAGDIVLVHPPWRDDIVDALRASGTMPAGVVVTEAFTRRHGDPWPAVTVVAEGVHPWPRSLEARRIALGVDVVESSGLRVFRLPADAAPQGSVDLGRARVRVERSDGATVPCPWDEGRRRHVCRGLGPWMTVGEETMQVGGEKTTCTWSHPISRGRLLIDYGNVDLGDGLEFQAALSDVAAANPEGAPVTFTVRINDTARLLTVHRQRGFSRLSIPKGGVARVVIEVATDNDGQRHACHRIVGGSR